MVRKLANKTDERVELLSGIKFWKRLFHIITEKSLLFIGFSHFITSVNNCCSCNPSSDSAVFFWIGLNELFTFFYLVWRDFSSPASQHANRCQWWLEILYYKICRNSFFSNLWWSSEFHQKAAINCGELLALGKRICHFSRFLAIPNLISPMAMISRIFHSSSSLLQILSSVFSRSPFRHLIHDFYLNLNSSGSV